MGQLIEVNEGEVLVKFTSPTAGKVTFKELGISNDQLVLEGGFLRLVFDLEGIGEHSYYAVPTVEVAYMENVGETHWQCDFNEETILDMIHAVHLAGNLGSDVFKPFDEEEDPFHEQVVGEELISAVSSTTNEHNFWNVYSLQLRGRLYEARKYSLRHLVCLGPRHICAHSCAHSCAHYGSRNALRYF